MFPSEKPPQWRRVGALAAELARVLVIGLVVVTITAVISEGAQWLALRLFP